MGLKTAWTNTIVITLRTKGPEEWKGFKNKFVSISQLLVTFVPENRQQNFLSTNDTALGIERVILII